MKKIELGVASTTKEGVLAALKSKAVINKEEAELIAVTIDDIKNYSKDVSK